VILWSANAAPFKAVLPKLTVRIKISINAIILALSRLIVIQSSWNEHMKVLRDFFERVWKANLSLKPSKCKVGFAEVDVFGHTLQNYTIRPQIETVGRIVGH